MDDSNRGEKQFISPIVKKSKSGVNIFAMYLNISDFKDKLVDKLTIAM